jgi:ABC-2 type transport system ATP-binding protein
VDAVIRLENLRKRYGKVEALRGLTASIEGQKIGLLGQNGAGKSTLIKIMLGLEPGDGEVRVLGLDPARQAFAIRDRVGYMPESESFLPGMNAVELCTYAGELSGLPRAAAMQRAHQALYYANLEDKRYQPVAGYSTGMKQRVKLAQALVHDPELLFLDEPTNGLDPKGREEMLELIDELPGRRGCAIILSTHLLPDVERLCDHVVMLHQGAIEFAGTLAALRGEDEARFEVRVKDGRDRLRARLVELGCEADEHEDRLRVRLPAGATTQLVFQAAIAAGVQLRHLAPEHATLESAFLRVVDQADAARKQVRA